MAINLKVGVKILLKNKENKYLLLKRSSDKYADVRDNWDIVGGRIEAGFSLSENLKREIKEETQLDFKGQTKLIGAQDIIKLGMHVVRLTYIGEIEGEPVISQEHTAYKWLTLDEMRRMKNLDSYLRQLIESGVSYETHQ